MEETVDWAMKLSICKIYLPQPTVSLEDLFEGSQVGEEKLGRRHELVEPAQVQDESPSAVCLGNCEDPG